MTTTVNEDSFDEEFDWDKAVAEYAQNYKEVITEVTDVINKSRRLGGRND